MRDLEALSDCSSITVRTVRAALVPEVSLGQSLTCGCSTLSRERERERELHEPPQSSRGSRFSEGTRRRPH
eukprot:1432898-Alexandrium_andersonii.AAC.1